jgi:hypothetical protein
MYIHRISITILLFFSTHLLFFLAGWLTPTQHVGYSAYSRTGTINRETSGTCNVMVTNSEGLVARTQRSWLHVQQEENTAGLAANTRGLMAPKARLVHILND